MSVYVSWAVLPVLYCPGHIHIYVLPVSMSCQSHIQGHVFPISIPESGIGFLLRNIAKGYIHAHGYMPVDDPSFIVFTETKFSPTCIHARGCPDQDIEHLNAYGDTN